MNELVSIIVPCYNYAHFVVEAVESVLQQSYTNFECIIIDDGSKDNTQVVAEALVKKDKRVKFFQKANGGLSSARNFGIKHAKGEYICFLDADDLLGPEKLAQQMQCFYRDASLDIVYGSAMFFEHPDKTKLYFSRSKAKQNPFLTKSGPGKTLVNDFLKTNFTVISAPLIKRRVIEKVGVFDEHYKSYEDWQFWIRCAFADCNFFFCEQSGICTLIRFGYESMMTDSSKLLRAGIQLRKEINGSLTIGQKLYNNYRLLRSLIKLKVQS